MKIYYEESDLVSFAKYVLSSERTRLVQANESPIPVRDQLKEVYHADLENWKEKQKTF